MKASECYKLCNRELDCRPEERDFLVTWKRTLARLDDFDRTFATAAQKLVMSTKPEEARCKWNGKGGESLECWPAIPPPEVNLREMWMLLRCCYVGGCLLASVWPLRHSLFFVNIKMRVLEFSANPHFSMRMSACFSFLLPHCFQLNWELADECHIYFIFFIFFSNNITGYVPFANTGNLTWVCICCHVRNATSIMNKLLAFVVTLCVSMFDHHSASCSCLKRYVCMMPAYMYMSVYMQAYAS